MSDFAAKTDAEINNWISNYERNGRTSDEFYHSLLEERARRQSKVLKIEKSLALLIETARRGRGTFTTYGELAEASSIPWSRARHSMNGPKGHLDNLLDVCHARKLPLLTALCVNQQGVSDGMLEPTALTGFTNGARRLGYLITDEIAFLKNARMSVSIGGSQLVRLASSSRTNSAFWESSSQRMTATRSCW